MIPPRARGSGQSRTRTPRWLRALAASLYLFNATPAFAHDADEWPVRLQKELHLLERDYGGGPAFGVYVRDLGTGLSVSHRAQERWYLASSVKVPVAIALLRAVEQHRFALDTTLVLRAGDYVDGAGPTNHLPPGTPLTLRFLLDQMIVYSDNTASDMLIGLLGVDEVNAVAQTLMPSGFERITTLADVRLLVYAQLTPNALHLSESDFLQIQRQGSDAERLRLFSHLVETPVSDFSKKTLQEAYDSYYAKGLNSGRLDAYGELLARLATGQALAGPATSLLLETMARVKTGTARLRAGLPPGVRFAHKTGTQRERVCDSGIITVPGLVRDRNLVVAACTRGEPSLPRAEQMLRNIGEAIHRAGALAI